MTSRLWCGVWSFGVLSPAAGLGRVSHAFPARRQREQGVGAVEAKVRHGRSDAVVVIDHRGFELGAHRHRDVLCRGLAVGQLHPVALSGFPNRDRMEPEPPQEAVEFASFYSLPRSQLPPPAIVTVAGDHAAELALVQCAGKSVHPYVRSFTRGEQRLLHFRRQPVLHPVVIVSYRRS